MKKIIGLIALLGAAGLFIVGCGAKSGVSSADLPSWVINPPHVLSAVGSAKVGNSLPNAMNIATERARAELAKNVSSQVETKFKDLTNTDAAGNVDGGTTAAIRNSADLLVKAASRTEVYEDKDNGDLYVLVEVKQENIKVIDEYLRSSKAKVNAETSKIISKAVDDLIDGSLD